MRESIKKILREYESPPEGTTEERIQEIENRFEEIKKMMPTIIRLYKSKYRGDLEKIDVDIKNIHYGNENYTGKELVLKLYFSDNLKKTTLRGEVWDYMKNFFGIDMTYYGVPIDVEVYVKNYIRV